jgi:hypothetical protein
VIGGDSAEFYSIKNLVDHAGQQPQRGLAFSLASEQDEEEKQLSMERRRTRY